MLAARAIADELMDGDDVAADTYAAVVRDLARVNTLTLARRPTLAFLDSLAPTAAPLRLLDVGYGDGDMLRAIAHWARARNQSVDLVGIDLNPRSAPAARAATDARDRIDYRTGDYAALAGERWDVIVSSLVAHHMTRAQLVAFVRFMAAHAAQGWFVNDLYRSIVAQTAFRFGAALLGLHPIVRHDGALSVARSYRVGEWAPILADAGASHAHVRRVFPYRLCVACRH